MYKRVRLKDTVEVPPEELGDVSPNRVKRLLQDKLEGRMDEEVGSIVSVTNVHDIGEGRCCRIGRASTTRPSSTR